MQEHHRKNLYGPCFLYCQISKKLGVDAVELSKSSVEVIFDSQLTANSNLLKVIDTKRKPKIKNITHVCVKPVHSSFSRAAWLVEWLEANQLMGVSHFYMYNQSMSDSIRCILEHYLRLGVVTLLPWNLPLSAEMVYVYGQAAAFNDCLYRSMSQARWLLNIDLDELVFTRRKQSLANYLNKNSRLYITVASAFCFQNTFFYLNFTDDSNENVTKYPLLTSRKTFRMSDFEGYRGKCAVRPYHVVEMGNHEVWQFTIDHFSVRVKTEEGALHHYRTSKVGVVVELNNGTNIETPPSNCTGPSSDCEQGTIVLDYTAHLWADDLLERVKLRRLKLESCLPSNLYLMYY